MKKALRIISIIFLGLILILFIGYLILNESKPVGPPSPEADELAGVFYLRGQAAPGVSVAGVQQCWLWARRGTGVVRTRTGGASTPPRASQEAPDIRPYG